MQPSVAEGCALVTKSVAIVGGGIAGLAAAYEFTKQQQAGADLTFTLFEASNRLGGIVDTVRQDGYVLEGGPDGWVSEKPWARELAIELGLEQDLIYSNDAERVTYILRNGKLLPLPDGMRMMVPTDLHALEGSPLFSDEARHWYRTEPLRAAELKANAPDADESVASFVLRHFGREVLETVGAPLLNGVFGGDVHQLSVQAVMQPFVQMEREFGSLIVALQTRARTGRVAQPIFTSLRGGVAQLTYALAATLPSNALLLNRRVLTLARAGQQWHLHTAHTGDAPPPATGDSQPLRFDAVLLALPVWETRRLLQDLDPALAALLETPGSSALTVAYALPAGQPVPWPKGFGFLALPGGSVRMLAATFADQKFPHRAPAGGHSVRVYYGGSEAEAMRHQDVKTLAYAELERIVGALPKPLHSSVRYWPMALPQYHVGHLQRVAELDRRVAELGGLQLLGNGFRGVGLPDLIRDARVTARAVASASMAP